MATLNGVEFGIVNKTTTVIHDNNIIDIPGSDTVVNDDAGYSTGPMQITGHVKNESEFDDFKGEFYGGGDLTLIADPDSGKQYTVYASGNVTELDGDNTYPLTDIVFQCSFFMKYPYLESVTEVTRTKTITSNNQEWSADDSANDIDTSGSVDAVPDIQVKGGTTNAGIIQTDTDSNYNLSNSLSTVSISYTGTSGSEVITSSNRFGQTINCRKAGMAILDSIQINVQTVTVAGDVTCSVYDGTSGTLIDSKVLAISSTGVKTYTFTTPIAIVQSETTCSDASDGSKIFFEITATGSTSILIETGSDGYADGSGYRDGGAVGWDMYFVASGHSCKEIRQTFTVSGTPTLYKVIINLCKYNYGGSNAVTVVIKDGGTTLGTGTAVLTGSTFSDVIFVLSEQTTNSLDLASGTTYTIVITPPSDSANATAILIKTKTTSVYANGAVTLVEDGGTTRLQTQDLYFSLPFLYSNGNVEIYNTDDSTVKCAVANKILNGAVHRINVDGTGTIYYDDNFTTDKWSDESIYSGITHDTGDDELDIADDGYIYWKCDAKYPISGTPTLTSQINITTGTPTIQISSDGSTWYDIDTAIVDDVDTEYPLDSDGNLSLAGKTLFYFRFDCVKAATATCSIKSFELDVAIHTIYAKNPIINKGATASTFRCDQNADSSMNCEVKLIYPARWWA